MSKQKAIEPKAAHAVEMRKEIWAIAVPAIIESLFNTFSSIIDSKMISQVGTQAIAAISVTNQPRLFVMCVFFAMNTSLSALVAHAVGANDKKKANQLLVTALTLTIGAALVLGIGCALLAAPIMQVCSGQKDTMDLSIAYYQILMSTIVFTACYTLINSALRGCGNTKVTMVTNIASTLVHIASNFLIIEGRFGFPRLGVVGAGISCAIGSIVALAISMGVLMRDGQFISMRYVLSERVRFSMERAHELFAMWKNICLENLLTRLGFLLASMMTARTGSLDTSIYHVTLNLMNINFAIGDGLQASAVALVGRSVGKHDVGDVRNYTKTIFRAGMGAAVILMVIFVAGGNWYYSFFSSDPEFISRGFVAAVLVAVMTPFQIPQIIFNGVLKCMNCTKQTLYITVFTVTFLNVVLDYILCFVLGYGLWGIMAASAVTQIVRAVLLELVYRKHLPMLESSMA